MRNFVAALLAAALLAPASLAQVPVDAAPSVRDASELQKPEQPEGQASDKPAAAKPPPTELSTQQTTQSAINVTIESIQRSEPVEEEPKRHANDYEFWGFVEHWSWLIGFILVAAAAFYAGVRDSIKAVTREIDAEDARSAQRMIEAGDDAGQGKLDDIKKKYPIDPKQKKRVRKWWWLFLTIGVFFLGALGIVWLLVLTLAAENDVFLGVYHFKHAQASAWDVLNSNFTTAFAATWIAALFYGASQNHRLREANGKLRIATDEAESVRKFRADREQDKAFDRYTEIRAAVATQTFETPGLGSGENDQAAKRHVEDFRRVQAVAIARALNDVELHRDDPLNKINEEIRRLKPFAAPPPHMGWFMPWDFGIFLGRVVELFPENKAEWKNLYAALSAAIPDDTEIRANVKALADKLPRPRSTKGGQ